MANKTPLSKYQIIVNAIKKDIADGSLSPGDPLPSENYMSQSYGISRMTVRKALAVLINESYIYSVQGKGHFVSKPDFTHFDINFKRNDDQDFEHKLLSVDIVDMSDDLRIRMQNFTQKKIIEVKQRIFNNGEVVGYDITYLHYNPKEPVLEKEFHYINIDENADNGEKIKKHVTLAVRSSDEHISSILEVEIGFPIIQIEATARNEVSQIIRYGKSYFKGNAFKIRGQ